MNRLELSQLLAGIVARINDVGDSKFLQLLYVAIQAKLAAERESIANEEKYQFGLLANAARWKLRP